MQPCTCNMLCPQAHVRSYYIVTIFSCLMQEQMTIALRPGLFR